MAGLGKSGPTLIARPQGLVTAAVADVGTYHDFLHWVWGRPIPGRSEPGNAVPMVSVGVPRASGTVFHRGFIRRIQVVMIDYLAASRQLPN